MKRWRSMGALLVAGSCAALVQSADADSRKRNVWARLIGLQEAPAVITPARGWFRATIDEDTREIDWRLSYEQLEGDVLQAHLHIGQHHVNGGISVWLCANPPASANAPAGTPLCPASPGSVSGTATVDSVVGPVPPPSTQGIVPMTPEGFDDLVRAIRAGVVYANVHTTIAPPGEIRGQLF